MDPQIQIRIRIHIKMSCICNTGSGIPDPGCYPGSGIPDPEGFLGSATLISAKKFLIMPVQNVKISLKISKRRLISSHCYFTLYTSLSRGCLISSYKSQVYTKKRKLRHVWWQKKIFFFLKR
jgi:hypothetical protein